MAMGEKKGGGLLTAPSTNAILYKIVKNIIESAGLVRSDEAWLDSGDK
jgi:hypothetical protein